jgi:hypothetical protein
MGFLKSTIGAVVKPVAKVLGMGGGGGGGGGYYGEDAPIKRGDAPLPVAGALTPEQGNEALRNNLMLLNSRYTPEERSMNALANRYAPGQRSAYDMWMNNYQSNNRVNALTFAPEITRRLPYVPRMEMTPQGQRMSSYQPYGQYNFNDYYGSQG